MTGFVAASTFERIAAGDHRGVIDAGWAQGRGAYGGLVTAMLVRALESEAPKGQAITTIHAAFVAPATEGAASIATETVRTGRNVSVFRASLVRETTTLATAIATFARSREGALVHRAITMPDAPPPENVSDGPEEHYIPAFARRFAFGQTHGPRPFSGGSEARVAGWCRLREEGVAIDAALVAALLDAWPPAAAAVAPAWCPVASIDLSYDFFVPLPVAHDWLFYDASASVVEGGLTDEHAWLFARDGTPIASSRQRIALFPPEPR